MKAQFTVFTAGGDLFVNVIVFDSCQGASPILDRIAELLSDDGQEPQSLDVLVTEFPEGSEVLKILSTIIANYGIGYVLPAQRTDCGGYTMQIALEPK
jgi:hypothetical protein